MNFVTTVINTCVKQETPHLIDVRHIVKDHDSWISLEEWIKENCKGKWAVTMREITIYYTESNTKYNYLDNFPTELHFAELRDASVFSLRWI